MRSNKRRSRVGVSKAADSISDEELMAQYQEGDFKAFELLYDRLSGKIYGYLRKRVQNKEAVEELFQMVFMKLHQTKSQWDSNQSLSPWLFAICRSTVVDAARKGLIYSTIRFEPVNENLKDPSGFDPANSSAHLEITGVPAAQAEVVKLHLEEDLNFEEISRRLSIKPEAARQRFSRAIRTLRKVFKE